MKFCSECDNMYYICANANDTNKIQYYCRKCGNVDTTITQETLCVLDTQLKTGSQTFNHIINKYTKLDPTLPRIYNVKCPNAECATNEAAHKKPAEVIYMRYDDTNMKYLYICTECNTTWKTDDRK
jgi:DNA-directed RNA polymerase subunit M/transcription elongation factor TFIIS